MNLKPSIPIMAAILVMSSGAANADDGPTLEPAPATATLIQELEADNGDLKARNQKLTAQNQRLRAQSQRLRTQNQRLRDRAGLGERVGAPVDVTFETQQAEWDRGYLEYGGANLATFHVYILPCESGGTPDPFSAASPTDDWGRGQVNAKTWQWRFEQEFGVRFHPNIFNPYLNGAMSAIIEQEHVGVRGAGLWAWTCFKGRTA